MAAKAPAPVTPTGRQIEIASGDHKAIVVEVGGGIRTYEVDGQPVIDGYPEHEMCRGGRGQALLPWPNRIADGSYEFGGVRYQLPLTEPAGHNAIHGLTRFAAWTAERVEQGRVVLAHRLHPQPGYPFMLDLRLDYRIGGDGLTVRCEATNVGSQPCPFGAGFHPYVAARGVVDDLVLRSPAATWFEADARGIPVARHPVEGSPYDFRAPRRIGDVTLDTAFTDFERDSDGRATVVLAGGGREVTVWMGPRFTDVMLYSGDTLDARRRQGLAVEPMTCPPDAFRSGERLMALEPGATFEESWGISSRSG